MAAIVCCLIVLMVFEALTGKQMLFCEMDGIFFLADLICLQEAASIKSSLQNEKGWRADQFGFNLRLKAQMFGSIQQPCMWCLTEEKWTASAHIRCDCAALTIFTQLANWRTALVSLSCKFIFLTECILQNGAEKQRIKSHKNRLIDDWCLHLHNA